MRLSWLVLGAVCGFACGSHGPPEHPNGGALAERPRVALGTETACAIGDDDRLRCWGRWAAKLADLGAVQAVGIGDGVGCALRESGSLVCWGRDLFSAEPACFAGADVILPTPLPPSTPPSIAAECPPRAIDLGAPVDAMWVGSTVGCARLATGALPCWGGGVMQHVAPPDGPATEPRRAPALERALANAGSFAISDDHGCFVDGERRVHCFGDDTDGQLGDGGSELRAEPVLVDGLTDVRVVRVSEQRSCALDGDGHVWCWGSRGLDNPELDRHPVRIEAPEPLATLAISRLSGCGRGESGRTFCWGAPFRARFGLEADGPVRALVEVPGFEGASDVATGVAYTCARRGEDLVCAGEVAPAMADLAPAFIAPTRVELPARALRSDAQTACTADADCLLGGPACCEPCNGWPVVELVAVHRNDVGTHRGRVCPEAMSCPECAVPEPPADARCIDRECRVVPRAGP